MTTPEEPDRVPRVTSPDWVAWVEEETRRSRTEAAASGARQRAPREPREAAEPRGPREPREPSKVEETPGHAAPDRDRRVPPVPSLEEFAAWQRVRELEAELSARRRRTARSVRLVAGAAALVLAAGAGAFWWSQAGGDDAPDTRARATTASAPLAAPPDPPVELPAGAEHTEVRVLESGDLAVEQWIRGTQPLSGVDLAPPVLDVASGEVRVSGLDVVAGKHRVPAPSTLVEPTRLTFGAAQEVYLSYRISGVLERSGDDGRALARVTSLDVGYEGATGPDTIAFANAALLSLACSPLASDGTSDGIPVPCGTDEGAIGWRVVPPPDAGDVQVMAQLDLPPSA